MKTFCLIFAISILASVPAQSSWVHIEGESSWKARAIQGTVVQYLSGFERLAVEDMPPLNCESLDCILHEAQLKNVQALFIGNLSEKKFLLKAYAPKTNRLVSQFNFSLNKKADLNELKHQIFLLVKPFIDIGGILDQEEMQSQIPQSLFLKILFFLSGLGSAVSLLFLGNFASKHYSQIKKKIKIESKTVKVTAAVITVGFVGFILIQSLRYHSIYEERQDKIKLQEQKNGGK